MHIAHRKSKISLFFLHFSSKRLVWIPRKKLPGEADDDAEDLPDDEVNEIDSSKIDEEIENLVSSDDDDNDVAWVQGDALGGQVQKYLYICLSHATPYVYALYWN